jgi:hypothetical protein
MIACARSSSWRTLPQDVTGLLVVKTMAPPAPMAVVDDVKEHVRGVGPVRQIANLVDDEHRRCGNLHAFSPLDVERDCVTRRSGVGLFIGGRTNKRTAKHVGKREHPVVGHFNRLR